MKFESVSIILPTLKETDSFVQAVSMILDMNPPEDIKEFIAVVCDRTNPESFKYIEEGKKIAEAAGVPLKLLYQTHPFFGGAMRDGFDAAEGSHICVVTPDLDTAPEKLPELIALAKQYPGDIAIASRWKKGGGFGNYSKFKMIWNFAAQKFLDVLYFTTLSDFTWSNQLTPAILARAINYQEEKHPMSLERVVVPLRLGIRFHEIPAKIQMPEEGESVNPLHANFVYLRPAFRCRFAKKKDLVRPGIDWRDLVKQLQS